MKKCRLISHLFYFFLSKMIPWLLLSESSEIKTREIPVHTLSFDFFILRQKYGNSNKKVYL